MSLGWISDYQIGLKAGAILLLVWSALIFKRVVFTRALHRVRAGLHADPLSVEIAEKIFSVVVYFMGLLLLLQVFGIDVVPILTLSGIGAAAVALAGRDVIANLVGGAVLYASRSFVPSDFIELPGKKIEGNVEKIGWYFTTLRDSQGRPIYIPNSLFSTELILNHSRITRR